MSTFQYREELRRQQIRLLRLLPGDWLDDLKAELYVADQTQRYAALSYAWGSTRKSNGIIVNSEVMYITFNLDRALRAIRRSTSTVTVWVDSICINQTDGAEKSHQVGLMHDIFSSATQVIAYVGDGLDRSRKDYKQRFDRLGKSSPVRFTGNSDDLPQIENALELWRTSPPGSLSEHQEILCLCSIISSPLHVDSAERLQKLLPNQATSADEQRCRQIHERIRLFAVSDWWNRMWIIQEACVAKELTLTYGRVSIPFKAISQGTRMFVEKPSSNPSELDRVVSYLAGKADTIDLSRVQGSYRASALALDSSLLWLLRNFRDRRSTEPRDKIFALLRLADDLRSETAFSQFDLRIDLDYTASVKAVFSQVTHKIIQQTGLLWITSFDLLAKTRSDVPSWVPDWSSDYMIPGWDKQRIRLHAELFLGFNSSRSRFRHTQIGAQDRLVLPQEHLQRLVNRDVGAQSRWEAVHYVPTQITSHERDVFLLGARGVSCGSVQGISDVIANDLSNVCDVIHQLMACYVNPSDIDDRRYPPPHREDLLEVVARCLCYSTRIEAGIDGYCSPRGLNAEEVRQISNWTLSKFPEGSSNLSTSSLFVEELARRINALEPGHELTMRICWSDPKLEYTSEENTLDIKPRVLWDWADVPEADISLYYLKHGIRLMSFPRGSLHLDPKNPEIFWAENEQWIKDTVQAVASGSRLFVTFQGQIGLGPERMRRGDEVCILEGGLMPYILRRRWRDNDPSVTMVGTCYAEGIMHWGDEARGYGDDPADIEGLEHKVRRKMPGRPISEEEFLIF